MSFRVIFLAIVILFLASSANAEPSAKGVHGMALVKVGEHWVASHMPLHGSIHAHQVVMKIKAASSESARSVNQLLEKESLVSLRPQVFDLHDLMSGKLHSFNADVYAGHFEREGKKTFKQLGFVVEEMLLIEPIEEGANGSFYRVDLDETFTLLIHKLAKKPSFDQIIWLEKGKSAEQSTKLNDRVTLDTRIPLNKKSFHQHPQLKGFNWRQMLYLETQDFQ
ncbi:hypothetical protein [Pleionea sp. CnH1-48]|uniref:hypothetical protein n=1 Tax=Pleionea sp. CnH1-48 TaxID=2954494 RepID=UPI002097E7FA|nr:hypothetical protein [Pleionea sp. CnH1-48]MCO7222949.1 hypothetical protein [Pleionea sp. CnH1-48]